MVHFLRSCEGCEEQKRSLIIQSDSGGNVNILGGDRGDNIGHCKKKVRLNM